jgi:hypothetical protein
VKVKLKSEFAYLNSIVKVYTNESTYRKELRGNDGSFNQIDHLFFGLPEDETIQQIGVIWSNANEEEEIFSISPINETVILEQNGSVSADSEILQPFESNFSNFPNPFNPSTTIEFSIEPSQQNEQITLEIYNIKGQRVRQFKMKNVKSKINEVVWNGDDESGKPVSSGIYLYQLKIDGKTEAVRKCLLLK